MMWQAGGTVRAGVRQDVVGGCAGRERPARSAATETSHTSPRVRKLRLGCVCVTAVHFLGKKEKDNSPLCLRLPWGARGTRNFVHIKKLVCEGV